MFQGIKMKQLKRPIGFPLLKSSTANVVYKHEHAAIFANNGIKCPPFCQLPSPFDEIVYADIPQVSTRRCWHMVWF